MTTTIVAITSPWDFFVCVSDEMTVHGDRQSAEAHAAIGNRILTPDWNVAHSADDSQYVAPIIEVVKEKIKEKKTWSADELKEYFSQACSAAIQRKFLDRHLRRYGYENFEQFRQRGRQELVEQFYKLCQILDDAELGSDFIVYGYDFQKAAHLFIVSGKGEILDQRQFKYAVIGRNRSLALSYLRRKASNFEFIATVGRLLEAKFFTEAGTDGEKSTTITFKGRLGDDISVAHAPIAQIKGIWETDVSTGALSKISSLVAAIQEEMEDANAPLFWRGQFLSAAEATTV